MRSSRSTFALVAGVGALAVALPAAAAIPVLKGSVGPGFTIKLAKKPTKPGKYTFVISDKASIHNFHLVGPGVNKKLTSIDGTGTSKPVTLTLKKGTYKFFCDLHPNLRGSFKIA
jgi:plastocyanin